MQAAVNAEMQVAAKAETSVVVIGRRSEDNRMKMWEVLVDGTQLYYNRKVRC